MHLEEALLQTVREAKAGSKEKARAWVEYMRAAKTPSEPRRTFADMMRKHLKWPLSMPVMVMTPSGYLRGTVSGHIRDYPHRCWIKFDQLVNYDGYGERYSAIVPFRSIRPVKET